MKFIGDDREEEEELMTRIVLELFLDRIVFRQ